ncbi:HAMP domain-containing histidine kinase [Bacillus sp. ISL-41]|uniref:sensor histidine kinase n=1 Tax=Bacillus sp. ISL-41 TaxID=2819127 RepID=UPI001BE917D0|nr:HAMP domain-containing sensor histidine kinase [Bacillus sp. ISL-41]MBT2644088.1 HAMP domain-containing histidine kinase [Bacillus sp. ISL-41]
MKLPETIMLQTNQVQPTLEKEVNEIQVIACSKPFHFSTEMDMHQPLSQAGPTSKKSFLIHKLAISKDDLIMNDLDQKKADLQSKSLKLEQEIVEKEQTLMILQKAIQTATGEYQAVSASHLAAGLAHEIRNPLTTLKGFIQLLKPELQAVGKQEFVDVALDEINRANSLLTDFLSVLKPGSSEKEKLSMNELAASMIKLFSSEAILKDIEISGEFPGEELYVFVDKNALKQVLVNLLKNAIEAVEGNHHTKASIKLVVSKDRDSVAVSVIDNGGGIDECTLKKIFSPFYTTKTGGTGMGLAICKQIIENHGGELSVTTQPFKTIFKFSLPAG